MNYVLLDDQGTLLKYPASPVDVKKGYPNTSFPSEADDAFWAQYYLYPVLGTAQPVYDFFAEYVVEGDPEFIEGTWQQVWVVKQIPAADLVLRCDYQAFWDAMLVSAVYQTVRAQASTSLAVNCCATEFIAAMSDAKAGRPNGDAIQMCIWLLFDALTLTAEESAEMQNLLAVGNMDRLYTLVQPT